MSPADRGPETPGLPLRADAATGAIVGTFLVATCLAGPIGLGLALIAWVVIDAFRRRKTGGQQLSSEGETTVDEYGARFRELEDDILKDR